MTCLGQQKSKEQEGCETRAKERPKRKKKENMEKWKIIYANVQGLQGKRTSIKEIIDDDVKPEIVLFAETHLRNNIGVKFGGYRFFGQARNDSKGGGVGILINENIKHRIAPHTSDKNIEILWISVNRGRSKPLFIGVYYGRQECRVNKEEIEQEMEHLKEEILEIRSEGEIILMMDGNGKVGLLGKKTSRNGKLLENFLNIQDSLS